MKLVSETSEEDRAKVAAERAQSAARWEFEGSLRLLTANLIRVTRGAGDGYKIGKQTSELLEAAQQYRDAFGHWPSDADYSRALHHTEDRDPEYGPYQWRQDALNQIIRGSLQVAASRMLDQPLQVSAGEREMDNGLRYYSEWLEEGRKQRAEADRIARASARTVRKKPVPRKK